MTTRAWLPIAAMLAGACTPTPAPMPNQRLAEIEAEIRERFPTVRQLAVDAFARDRGDAVVVDVRAPAEFAVSRIPGARNVPHDSDLRAGLADVARDRQVVLYCSVGYRSSMAAEQLAKLGYTDVQNLEGSLFAWANAGHPLEGGDRVHPYDAKWGELLDPRLRAPLGR